MKLAFNSIDDFINLKITKQISRLGTIFHTKSNSYLYDTGTGKAVQLDPISIDFFLSLFNDSFSVFETRKFWENIPEEKQKEILMFMCDEYLLQCPPVEKFYVGNGIYDEDKLKIQQIILEVTGLCNLRCKYCIYNDYNAGNRNFNTNSMPFEIAKKALDYAYAHHDSHFAVTFYGGEPLINFPLIKECIDYSLAEMKNCEELTFSLTTNLTLMTDEVADYLASIPGMNIVLSIDGPEDVHNAARVYANNCDTFRDVMAGLQRLSDALRRHPENHVGIVVNSVFSPPYSFQKLNRINDFFSTLDKLPDDVSIRISYPSPGTIPEDFIYESEEIGSCFSPSNNPLVEWLVAQSKNIISSKSEKNLYQSSLYDILSRIHNRMLLQKPYPVFHQNGCCIPGQRRLYVTTEGQYKVCERIGDSPMIGDVSHGLNIENIKKYYFDDYASCSIRSCSDCWAVRLCSLCFANCMTEDGIDSAKKESLCVSVRESNKVWLSLYHQIMEDSPNMLEIVKDLIIL